MKCKNSECVCPTCEHHADKTCWRRTQCDKARQIGYCKSYVAECVRYKQIVEGAENNG